MKFSNNKKYYKGTFLFVENPCCYTYEYSLIKLCNIYCRLHILLRTGHSEGQDMQCPVQTDISFAWEVIGKK